MEKKSTLFTSTCFNVHSKHISRRLAKRLFIIFILLLLILLTLSWITILSPNATNDKSYNNPTSAHRQNHSQVVLVTRYWGESQKDLIRLLQFIRHSAAMGIHSLVIGIHVQSDQTNAINVLRDELMSSGVDDQHGGVHVVPIQPWVGVTQPLNALIDFVASLQKNNDSSTETQQQQPKYVWFVSPEVTLLRSSLMRMVAHMDENTLVVGEALLGHTPPSALTSNESRSDFSVPLDGLTSPWNTCALWTLEMLLETHFPGVADLVDPPGMEEVAAIAQHQSIHGSTLRRAVLLFPRKSRHSKLLWAATSFSTTSDRGMKHAVKMKTKQSRARSILRSMNANNCTVNYILY